jgi:hypothetical protein
MTFPINEVHSTPYCTAVRGPSGSFKIKLKICISISKANLMNAINYTIEKKIINLLSSECYNKPYVGNQKIVTLRPMIN